MSELRPIGKRAVRRSSGVESELVREMIKAHTSMPSLTLAKMILAQHPGAFRDAETLRNRIRYWRGQHGDRKRAQVEGKRMIPRSYARPFESFRLCGPSRVLVMSDLHIPYHDERAVEAAVEYGRKARADVVLLNGDLWDCYQLSRYNPDPRERSTGEELRAVRDFFEWLRERLPKARIVYKLGNHELRWTFFLRYAAPRLLGIEEFDLPSVLHLGDCGVELVPATDEVMCGDHLHVLHGHEIGSRGGGVSPARGLYLAVGACALAGHWHRTSAHNEPVLGGGVVATYSDGCLCGLSPEYARINKWNLGFSLIELDNRGGFRVEQRRILPSGKVV